MTERKGKSLAAVLHLEALKPPRIGVQLASNSLLQSRDIASWRQHHHQLVDNTTASADLLLLVTPSGKGVSCFRQASVAKQHQLIFSAEAEDQKIRRQLPIQVGLHPVAWLDPGSHKIFYDL